MSNSVILTSSGTKTIHSFSCILYCSILFYQKAHQSKALTPIAPATLYPTLTAISLPKKREQAAPKRVRLVNLRQSDETSLLPNPKLCKQPFSNTSKPLPSYPPYRTRKTPGKNLSHHCPRFFYFSGKMPTHFRVRKKEK